jgi:two-component system response regulator DesR
MISVVLAEDQALVLGALAALLSLENDITIVAHVGDGEAALEAVRTHRPDVLLSDIEMPKLTGLDVAETLAREKASTKMFIVTTFGRAGYLRRAMDAGVRGYLLKDTPSEVLATAIRKVAAGGRAIAPELAEAAWDAPSNPLSDRERAVLRHADEGCSNKDIARMLDLSPGTVRNYLSEASTKLGAASRIEAARIARNKGWL